MFEFTETKLTRQEALFLWMRRTGLTQRELCEKLNLSTCTVSKYLNGEEIPRIYHSKLVELGLPVQYLPMPVDKKHGYAVRRVLG